MLLTFGMNTIWVMVEIMVSRKKDSQKNTLIGD